MRYFLSASRIEGGVFVSFLVVILVLAAVATFLYLQRTGRLAEYKLNMFSSIGTDDVVLEETTAPKEGEDLSIGVLEGEMAEEAAKPLEEVVQPSSGKEPEGEGFGGKQYVETAQKGDGFTHLARRAVKKYLEEHSPELSAEHKIFVEDYVQNRLGERHLEVGEVISVSEELIAEGLNKSQELTAEQLEYISNFTELIWEAGFRL